MTTVIEIPEASKMLREAVYLPEIRQLRVTFKNHSLYVYEDVPPDVIEDFKAAPSKGRFFHQRIRHGGFKWHMV